MLPCWSPFLPFFFFCSVFSPFFFFPPRLSGSANEEECNGEEGAALFFFFFLLLKVIPTVAHDGEGKEDNGHRRTLIPLHFFLFCTPLLVVEKPLS